jgi:hypothetical protein
MVIGFPGVIGWFLFLQLLFKFFDEGGSIEGTESVSIALPEGTPACLSGSFSPGDVSESCGERSSKIINHAN